MSLLNPALIYGLALAAVPIILHLMMRTKPKRVVFPALRLIQNRRRQNVRRIRLRHLWLLLLRTLVIAVIVAALLRPSLPAANYSLTTAEWLTLLGIGLVSIAVYFGVMAWWKRQELPNHQLASRRTSLRGGVGAAAFLLFALLVALPYQNRLAGEITAPLPEVAPDVPVAAVLLFDTSLSMEYRQQNLTRLDVAREIAAEHLSSLPTGSRVAIGDCSVTTPIPFLADRSAAVDRLDALRTGSLAHPINDRLRAALQLQEDDRLRTLEESGQSLDAAADEAADQLVREVYVFTDLARSAWRTSSAKLLRDELERLPWLSVYLIDVSASAPTNLALTELQLSQQEAAPDTDIKVEATLTATGDDEQSVTIELHTENATGELIKRDQTAVTLKGDEATSIQFGTRTGDTGTLRGQLRLVSSDPLHADDRLWFSVGTQPALRALVVASAPDDSDRSIAGSDANELVNLLRILNYPVTFQPASRLADVEFDKVDVVFLVNVPSPDDAAWQALRTFVETGGGLMAFLGSDDTGARPGIRSVVWNSPAAQELLPAELLTPLNARPPVGLDVKDTSHPVLREFAGQGVSSQVARLPVWRYWKVAPADDANVIARFTGTEALPALVERRHGAGRSLLFATAGNIAFETNRQWNRLAGEWPFMMLVDQSVQYLSGRSSAMFNVEAGADVVLPVGREASVSTYFLQKPSGVKLRGSSSNDARTLRLTGLDETGHFTVRSVSRDRPYDVGFSVNSPAGESDLRQMSETDLNEMFGENRYSVAQSTAALTRTVTAGRLGVEVFPIVLALVIAVFCLEHTVANRFYEADQLPETASQT
ncbi:MAG: BatA domain-containing protein [Planctomycetota bacterium]|jgi:hypothetical protein